MRRLLPSLILWLGLAAPTLADVVHLVGGGALEGKVVGEDKGGLVVRTDAGTTIVVPREQVREVERGASVDELHRARLRRIDPRDAEARYALGLWLKSLRRPDLARREFLAVLLLQPEHRFARAELGQARLGGEWTAVGAAPAGWGGATLPTRGEGGASAPARLPGSDVRELLMAELGCSSELAGALVDVRGKDRARVRAARGVLQDLSGEPARLCAALRAGDGPGELAWGAVLGARQGCCTRVEAPLDARALEALVGEHVERNLRPALAVLVPDLFPPPSRP